MKVGWEEKMQDKIFLKSLGILFIFLGFFGLFLPTLQALIFISIGIFLLIKSEIISKKEDMNKK